MSLYPRLSEEDHQFYIETFGSANGGVSYVLQSFPSLHRETLGEMVQRFGADVIETMLGMLSKHPDCGAFPYPSLVGHVAAENFDLSDPAQQLGALPGFDNLVLRFEALRRGGVAIKVENDPQASRLTIPKADPLTLAFYTLGVGTQESRAQQTAAVHLLLESFPSFYRETLADISRDVESREHLQHIGQALDQRPLVPVRQSGGRTIPVLQQYLGKHVPAGVDTTSTMSWAKSLSAFGRACLELRFGMPLYKSKHTKYQPISLKIHPKVMGDLVGLVNESLGGCATYAVTALQSMLMESFAEKSFLAGFSQVQIDGLQALLSTRPEEPSGEEAGEELRGLLVQAIDQKNAREFLGGEDLHVTLSTLQGLSRFDRMALELYLRQGIARPKSKKREPKKNVAA